MANPSYSFCAICMVRLVPKWCLRAASCCRVEVVNGAAGWRWVFLRSTRSTAKSRLSMTATAARAAASSESASLSSLSPSRWVSWAVNDVPDRVRKSASTVQYSRAVKASISVSRSQIRRSATDCTRPAERLPGSLRHNTGDRVKPTR